VAKEPSRGLEKAFEIARRLDLRPAKSFLASYSFPKALTFGPFLVDLSDETLEVALFDAPSGEGRLSEPAVLLARLSGPSPVPWERVRFFDDLLSFYQGDQVRAKVFLGACRPM